MSPRWFAPPSGGYSGTEGPPPRYSHATVTPTGETRRRRRGLTESRYVVSLVGAVRLAQGVPGTHNYRPPPPPWPPILEDVWALDDDEAEQLATVLLAAANATAARDDERTARTRTVYAR